jgi:hypothetical protein
LPDRAEDDLGLPDIYLMFFNRLLAHCHATGRTFLSYRGLGGRRHKAEFVAFAQHLKTLTRIKFFEETAATQPNSPHPLPLSQKERGVRTEMPSPKGRGEIRSRFNRISTNPPTAMPCKR